jgi:hypothetical protein
MQISMDAVFDGLQHKPLQWYGSAWRRLRQNASWSGRACHVSLSCDSSSELGIYSNASCSSYPTHSEHNSQPSVRDDAFSVWGPRPGFSRRHGATTESGSS